jgi:hypothetical protein
MSKEAAGIAGSIGRVGFKLYTSVSYMYAWLVWCWGLVLAELG